jgi:ADP-ribosyl-[dinitrogen reductase] hydrolase
MPQMTAEQGLGMWAGLFYGDAMGVPLEFTKGDPANPVTTLTSGGVHNASVGEWSDDGAMALAIAHAYIDQGGFCGASIMRNFIDWMHNGTFGTRPGQPAWDVGITVAGALSRAEVDTLVPYRGSTEAKYSGNGSIMRLAPVILWNRKNLGKAIGESVAQALLTHGSSETITYVCALAHELWEGEPLPQYNNLRRRPISNSGYVADTYASAWHSVLKTSSFEEAVINAINRGDDADTVGAVTGMIAGRKYGFKAIHDFNKLLRHTDLQKIGQRLTEG